MIKNYTLLLSCIASFSLISCEQTADPEQVKTLYEESRKAGTDGFCVTDHETADQYENLASIMRDMDYVCYQIYDEATQSLPDSVMVLNRRNINGSKTIIYDFASQPREFETWNRDEGYDKQEKLADRIFVRTLKMD